MRWDPRAAVLVAVSLLVGCGGPVHTGASPVRDDPAVPRAEAPVAPSPAPSGEPQADGWRAKLPRARVFWDRGIQYRFLRKPRLELDHGPPRLLVEDSPLIEGQIGFKLHVDAAGFVEREGIETIPDRVEVRRAFLTTRGQIHLRLPIHYNLEFGLLDDSFYLDSAWLMLRDLPWVGTFKLGGFDPPIGLANLASSRDRTFMEVPAPVQAFVPDTSPGIQIGRPFAASRGTWTFGFFSAGQRRDVGDQSQGVARLVGRATWLALDAERGGETAGPELLHVGLAGSVFSAADSVRYQSRPQSFLAPIAVDTGEIDARHSFVLGTEVAGRHGPLSFQGEYLQAFVDGPGSPAFPGLYVAAAYMLTGEVRPYQREQGGFGQVIPRRPLSLRARAFGAAECAAGYSWLDLDDGPVSGGTMHILSAGLNWYWNRYVRWQLDYELAFIDDGPLDGRLNVIQARFQLVI